MDVHRWMMDGQHYAREKERERERKRERATWIILRMNIFYIGIINNKVSQIVIYIRPLSEHKSSI